MATLNTTFSDGDILYAGTVGSTSNINGITTTVNSNTITKLAYIGSTTISTVNTTTTERTIATYTIPANTITTGIIAQASIGVQGVGNGGTFKLKIGPTSSEALKQTVALDASEGDSTHNGGSILFYDSGQTLTAPVTVLVTGTNGDSGAADECVCFQMVLTGY